MTSYTFLIMHIIIFFLSYGIYSFLYGSSTVFDESFSRLIIYFEITLYICVFLFLMGIIYILIIFPWLFLLYELVSLAVITAFVKLFLAEFFI